MSRYCVLPLNVQPVPAAHVGATPGAASFPLPDLTCDALRNLWAKHRHPRLLFPNPTGSPERIRQTTTHMGTGGTQQAVKALVAECGIKKRSPSTPCATATSCTTSTFTSCPCPSSRDRSATGPSRPRAPTSTPLMKLWLRPTTDAVRTAPLHNRRRLE